MNGPNDQREDDIRIDTAALFGALGSRLLRIVVVTAILLAATFVVLIFVPKSYESTASILVEPRDSTFLRATNDASAGPGAADATAIASQMELVQSRDTLLKVIKDEHLTDEPALTRPVSGPLDPLLRLIGRAPKPPADKTAIVLAHLTAGLDVVQERESRVFSIVYTASDPELAARIANAIAKAHVARRAGLVVEDTADATRWLQTEIEKLRTKVLDAETKVATFRIDNDLYVGNNNTSLVDQRLSDMSGQIGQAQERESTARSRATVLKALIKAGQPIDGVPAVGDNATIQQLSQEKARLQGERALKLATLLANHPDVRALTAQIDEIDTQITAEGRRIADSLDAEARVEHDLGQSLNDELTKLKTQASKATRNTVTLNELEREAKAERDLLETYLLRYRDASARSDVNSALPDVRIVTYAAAATSPSAPKTSLILGAVFALSLVGQAGLVLFGELISGNALREIAPQQASTARAAAIIDEPLPETPDEAVPFPEPAADDFAPDPEPVAHPVTPVYLDQPGASQPGASQDVADWDDEERQTPNLYEDSENPDETVDLLFVRDRAPEDEKFADAPDEVLPADDLSELDDRFAESADEWAPDEDFAPMSEPAEPTGEAWTVPDQEPPPVSEPVPQTAEPVAQADRALVKDTGIVFLASLGPADETESAENNLVADALERGLSVALVDAATTDAADEPGLSDLVHGTASFGEIVKRAHEGRVAHVPVGSEPLPANPSPAAVTLVHALAEIFDLVVVSVGRPGPGSRLHVFSGAHGAVVVLSPHQIDGEALDALRAEAVDLGFDGLEIMPLVAADMRVA